MPDWYFLIERYEPNSWFGRSSEGIENEIIELWKCIPRIGWYVEWWHEHYLYLIPNGETTLSEVDSGWINVPLSSFTTLHGITTNIKDVHITNTPHYYNILFSWDKAVVKNAWIGWIEIDHYLLWLLYQYLWKESLYITDFNMDKDMLYYFLSALLLTILIETSLLWIFVKLFVKESISSMKILLTWIVASWVKLPLLWYVLPIFITNWTWYIIGWEFIVFMIESLIIKFALKLPWWKAILVSLICNLSSFIIWFILFYKSHYHFRIEDATEKYLVISKIIVNVWFIVLLYNFLVFITRKFLNRKKTVE